MPFVFIVSFEKNSIGYNNSTYIATASNFGVACRIRSEFIKKYQCDEFITIKRYIINEVNMIAIDEIRNYNSIKKQEKYDEASITRQEHYSNNWSEVDTTDYIEYRESHY